MYIIREKDEIQKINNFFLSMNYLIEYYLFNVSINSGIPISTLVSLKKDDVLINNEIKKSITISGKTFLISHETRKILILSQNVSSGDYCFMNESNTNKYSRTQFYKKLKDAEKNIGINGNLTNKTCEYTFAYHYLIQTGDIEYLSKIFNKSKTQLIHEIFYTTNDLEDFKIL